MMLQKQNMLSMLQVKYYPGVICGALCRETIGCERSSVLCQPQEPYNPVGRPSHTGV